MSAQISQSRLTEADWVRAAIKRCEAKRDSAADAQSKWYYQMCLVGWRAHLKRLHIV